jgi:group I intron endonuclease
MKLNFTKNSGIYCFENLINNKKYIGQADNLYHRVSHHRSYLRGGYDGCNALQNSWNKYGEDNFDIYLIEECSIELLDEREVYWIKELHTHTTEGGLNISWGGDAPMRGRNHTDESKKKISENSATPSGELNRQYGIPRTDEEKMKISTTLIEYYKTHDAPSLGKKQSTELIEKRMKNMRGRVVSKETGRKISESNKGRKVSEEGRKNMSLAKIGGHLSETHKKNISSANKGKPAPNKGVPRPREDVERQANLMRGRKVKKNSSSKYVGVSYIKASNNWHSYINYNGKRTNIGHFKTEIDAAIAYNNKAIELFGEDARLNIIEEEGKCDL